MARVQTPDPGDPPDKLFLWWLDRIERTTAFVCRRHRLSTADAEDFTSHARIKLLEDDCRILRQYQGRAVPDAFLAIVINRLFQDYRNHLWGKWRPSARARRLGPLAVLLEQLIVRDGHAFDEACEIIRTNRGINVTVAELEALFAKLPRRVKRRFEGDQELADVPDGGRAPEGELLKRERDEARALCREALRRALAEFADQDRLILMYRFYDGLTMPQIAAIMTLDAKPLYRRIGQLLDQLRRRLQQDGIEAGSLFGPDDPADRPDEADEEDEPSDRTMASAVTDFCDDEAEKQWPVRL